MNEVKNSNPALYLAVDNAAGRGRVPSSPLSGSSSAPAPQAPASASKNAGRASSAEQASVRAEAPDRAASAEKLKQNQAEQQQKVQEAVSRLNDYVQSVQRDLQFEADAESGITVIRVVDQATKEVVRQIPDEVALSLAQKLQQDEPISLLNITV